MHEPGIDLPIGIVGTVTVCALLYALMALAIVGMVPASSIDISAPFSDAFLSLLRGSSGWGVREVLLATSARFVSFGALTGLPTHFWKTCLQIRRMEWLQWMKRMEWMGGSKPNSCAFSFRGHPLPNDCFKCIKAQGKGVMLLDSLLLPTLWAGHAGVLGEEEGRECQVTR